MENQNTSSKKSLIVLGVIAAMLALTGLMWALMGCSTASTLPEDSTAQEINVSTSSALAADETPKTKESTSKTAASSTKNSTKEDDDDQTESASKSTTSNAKDSADKSDKSSKGNNSSASTSSKKSSSAKTSATGWNMDIDCASCHSKEADLASDKKCVQGVAHEGAKLTCITCHTDEEVLTEVHADVSADDKMPKKATVETVDPETCETCHGSLEEVAQLTADSTALKDDNGTVVNPHQIPEGQRHEEVPATCTDCHNNHSTNLSKDAMKYCAQCHHRGRFECGTCHEIRATGEAK